MENGLPATASAVGSCAFAKLCDGRGVVAEVVCFGTTPLPPSLFTGLEFDSS